MFHFMDYAKAIKINQAALRRVVEEIFAWVELVLDGSVKRLPQVLHTAAYRLLVPAEAALRRLIVIAARDIKVTPPPPCPMPKGKIIIAKGTRPLKFQLYDTRKRFDRPPLKPKTITPRIHFIDFAPLVSSFIPQAKKQKTSLRLCRRFAAFKHALENIPHHAARLALWQARRAAKKETKFRFPLRPGAPPGARRNHMLKVDDVLKTCHALAIDLQRARPNLQG